jgi:type I restriction-modification system DNA methylase subunit
MTSETGFVENVLKAFKNIIKEIEKDSSEQDIRYRFVKYFIEEVLGYEPKYINWEKKRADLTIIDENHFAVIKIETKRPAESIDKREHEEQAFKYEEETTRFIGLTNFKQFKLWELKKTGSELEVNIDFCRILEQKKSAEQLSSEEKTQILFLNNLTEEILFSPSKYEKFDETYARIDITKETGFKKLLDRLNFIADDILLGYTLKAFGEYKEGHGEYQEELKKIDSIPPNAKNAYLLAKHRQKTEEEYAKYKTFGGFYLWKSYSGKEHLSDDEVKEIFCKESIYVLLNKLLFIRISEDKGLLEKNISNGGIEELRVILRKRFDKDIINKELLELSFKSAKGLYSHFYETGILDWFRTGDGELNDLLNRALWILNQFDFTHVDRDILGNLYEKYLPSRERKGLGEFYTPTEVIDYILTSVGYTYSHDIETKDLLDPACGSGGFLVRASRRLISRYLMKFGKTGKKELRDPKNQKQIVSRLSSDEAKIILESIQEHIYGLDINPFACHIAEMNLLFQIIDLYQKAKEKHPDYKLKRFRIYQTDSLEKPAQKQIWDYNYSAFLEEQEEIDAIKSKKFDFVVGNPPYVRVQMLEEKTKAYLFKNYESSYSNFDLYIVFIERGVKWLKESGHFGYIVSNQFITREYGRKLRRFLAKNVTIKNMVDFSDAGVFKDATNYPLIIIVKRESLPEKHPIKFIKVKSPKEDLIQYIFRKYRDKEYSDDYLEVNEIPQKRLSDDMWNLFSEKTQKILNKLEQHPALKTMLSKEGIAVGVQTGLNEAFIINDSIIRKCRVEKKLIRKLLDSKDVRRWKINWSGLYVIYPYVEKDRKTVLIKEDSLKNDYPNTYDYLQTYKDKLSKRWGVKQWYELPTARSFELFNKPKILTPSLSNKNNFACDTDGFFFTKGAGGSYSIMLNDEQKEHNPYVLGLINSKLLEFYLKQFLPIKSGSWYEYNRQYLEKLPIKLPETAEEKKIADRITKKVDEILELHKSGIVDIDAVLEGEETEKLYNLPKVAFNISDDAKFNKIRVDNSRIFINSQDFIEIKDKKIRDFVEIYLNSNSEKLSKAKDVKNMILNISVPKSNEVLKETIKKGGADQSQIKEKIKKLEDEINELVYQIYGITKEERRIVEENL